MDFIRLTQTAADAVGAAQRQLPPEIRALARGVPVHYERKPAPEDLSDGIAADTLGLFTGNARETELDHDNTSSAQVLQILLYLENLWDFAEGDVEIFRDEVRLTYLHELGHYLGWGEDELTARGLD